MCHLPNMMRYIVKRQPSLLGMLKQLIIRVILNQLVSVTLREALSSYMTKASVYANDCRSNLLPYTN